MRSGCSWVHMTWVLRHGLHKPLHNSANSVASLPASISSAHQHGRNSEQHRHSVSNSTDRPKYLDCGHPSELWGGSGPLESQSLTRCSSST